MWHRELVGQLKRELPRWRWRAHLNHQGGTLDGESQKQNIHVEIEYARGAWRLDAYGLLGHRQPQWVLTLEGVKLSSLDEVAGAILDECK